MPIDNLAILLGTVADDLDPHMPHCIGNKIWSITFSIQ